MNYRDFGRTHWQISTTGLGCWNLGNQWGELDDNTAEAIVKAALDSGVNLFDVAESYGVPNGCSELRVGRALQGCREDVFIVSKIGNWGKRTGQNVPKTTADMIRLCGHACCGRLQTAYVDVMLCHEGNIDDPSVYIDGFRQLRDEGFVREYGISTNDFAVLKRFHEQSDGECAAVEPDYSLLNRAPEHELLPYCQEHGIAVIVRGAVARGLLAGKYDRSTVFTDQVRRGWNEGEAKREQFLQMLKKVEAVQEALDGADMVTAALGFVLAHPAVSCVIPGATSPDQVKANAQADAEPLSDELLQRLRAATD